MLLPFCTEDFICGPFLHAHCFFLVDSVLIYGLLIYFVVIILFFLLFFFPLLVNVISSYHTVLHGICGYLDNN